MEPIQEAGLVHPGGVCDSLETVTGVIIFSLFLEDVSSDNMGNKEFSVGTFSFKEGISLTKFPTVEDVREAFPSIPYEYYSYGNYAYAHRHQ